MKLRPELSGLPDEFFVRMRNGHRSARRSGAGLIVCTGVTGYGAVDATTG